MPNQVIFKRYELKYLITEAQLKRLKEVMENYMKADKHGISTICNIYYDTPDFLLIRRSLDKPVYKEKLRVRSYGVATEKSTVFVELKKKFDGIVYKRRIEMTEEQSVEFLQERSQCANSQIAKEIDYALDFYHSLAPAVHLSYKREAFFGKDDKNLRITFDSEILYRTYDLSLTKGIYGLPVLSDGRYLMEVKTSTALPLWLVEFLSKEKILKTSFSKYGNAYLDIYYTMGIWNDIKRAVKNIGEAPFVKEMCQTTANMYRLGWDERNGGNISYLLNSDEVAEYLDLNEVKRTIPLGFNAKELAGKIFIVTGTGKYFKNVENDPENNLGIVRISKDGQSAELLWGFEDGGKFTSEFPAHLMSHIERLKVDPENRVVMHCHPTYTIAMNTVCPVDEKEFTHRLWQINTECIVVFPDGVGMLPWMVCGTNEIGEATAKKMQEYRLVVWTNHGIYGAGKTMDETFGLIETVEKAAQIYMLTEGHKRTNLISDSDLQALANRFGVTVKAGILKI